MAAIDADIMQELYEQIEAHKKTLKSGDKWRRLKSLIDDEEFRKIPCTSDGRFDQVTWSKIGDEDQRKFYLMLSTVRDSLPRAKQTSGYGAGLIATAILLPVTALTITVLMVLAEWPKTSAPLWASLAALVLWLGASFIFCKVADAKHAIPSSYGELKQRLDRLEATLQDMNLTSRSSQGTYNLVAYNETITQIKEIKQEIRTKGLHWVLASGYSNVWGRLYRAEEALIEVVPQKMVLAGAYYDEMRLEGSTIENRDDLLAKVRKAVDSINPGANKYLKTSVAVVPPAALAIVTSSLAERIVATARCEALYATGGTPPYKWAVSKGAIPDGVGLSPTGVLSGTPTNDGKINLTLQVSDSAGVMIEKDFTLTINKQAQKSSLAILTTSPLAGGVVAADYSEKLIAEGGTPPYKWKVKKEEELPDGLTLSSTGVLSGKPTTPSTFDFTVQVVDSTITTPIEKPIAVAVQNAEASCRNPDSELLARSVLREVRQSINEYRDVRWNGLIVARNRLLATFALTSFAVFTLLTIAIMSDAERSKVIVATVFFVVGATIGLANRLRGESQAESAIADYGLSAARLITIPMFCGLGAIGGVLLMALSPFASTGLAPSVSPSQTPAISVVSSPVATVAAAYSATLSATGGTPPYKWAVSKGAMPDGLGLSPTGVLSGTPSNDGKVNLTLNVSDSAGVMGGKDFMLTINKQTQKAPLAIVTTSPLAEGIIAADYFVRLLAEGGTPPYKWKIGGDKKLDGLTLSETGVLSGKPTTVNTFEFTVLVSDSTNTTEKKFTLPINQPGQMTPVPKPAPAESTVRTLDEVFDFKKNLIGLFVAAIFGLTPGLLFDRLQQQSDKYKADLKSTQSTQGAQKT